MFYIGPVAGLPKEKLSKVWTHTLSVFGLLAAVVTIISFLGFHPSNQAEKPKPQSPSPKVEAATHKETPPVTPVVGKAPKSNGTGTLHLDGGFSGGRPMLTTEAVQAGTQTAPLALTNSKTGRIEKIDNALAPLPIEAKHPVAVWDKGTRFVRGIRLTAANPRIHLAGAGLPGVDIPTDADGRLETTLVWPLDRMFTSVEYVGPVEISPLTLDKGVVFGDPDSQETGKTLPTRFSVDVPRPGEIMGAARGSFTYPTPSDTRYVVIQALSQSSSATATWTTPIDASGSATLSDMRSDLFNKELAGIRVFYSRATATGN